VGIRDPYTAYLFLCSRYEFLVARSLGEARLWTWSLLDSKSTNNLLLDSVNTNTIIFGTDNKELFVLPVRIH